VSWLRSAAFNLWFFGLTLLLCLLWLFRAPFGAPFGAGREIGVARLWARLALGGLRRICGISWQVSGLEHLPQEGPALLASMHQSAFDTIVWVLLAPRFAYVVKQELFRVPLFGAIMRRGGMIPVDRTAGPAALRALLRDADRARDDRRQVVIFPEGTRVSPGQRVRLHPGVAALAARMRVPVIPVLTDSGAYWGRRAFRKRPGVIRIALLPPLPVGLPRDEVLARLTEAFSTGLPASVDKSVGLTSGSL
jgi:1-acyl-sn-glycerol-3-phosphate acyltransferase